MTKINFILSYFSWKFNQLEITRKPRGEKGLIGLIYIYIYIYIGIGRYLGLNVWLYLGCHGCLHELRNNFPWWWS